MTDETNVKSKHTRATELRWLSEKMRGHWGDEICDMLDYAASDIDLLVDALVFAVGNEGGVKWVKERKMSGYVVQNPTVPDEAPERIRPLLYAAAVMADDKLIEGARDD